ncbi:DNA-binding response regulator, OmpR family, contains REC and winged-helix (wHTH) domain [Saccharopolyspora antimicrobica]|uniref:DNA-binding response regulator, OmpR family, contains REC and winged-helix (WHTH) domain n=1 Tax=Saccharopolyspora antimicrobica TaxID=455193 RepID=A0A1I5K2I3_9PSEU|nr:response regulator transcription factor [Saccharopolyspora antimicrobica]RKT84764.1 winged helix family two component transcriptional regulator [Saccharopolyspora antimicrobica]SFO79265.1 DNA-binding response regulator, OmpR family, contains REC and winged-helix (wHTH) domain [Saccharopolyspora antimicrobica]
MNIGPSGAQRRHRVLVVEDDPMMAEVIASYLNHAGMLVAVAADGVMALDGFQAFNPDLVILDRMLPRLDGTHVCRKLREQSSVPIILVTALGEQDDRIHGLELGADDYVTKPFSPRELVLRAQALLRRSAGNTAQPQPAPQTRQVEDLVMDLTTRQVTKAGKPLRFTGRERDLLDFFFDHPGETFRKDELMQRVWQWKVGDSSMISVYVRRLREKIETDPANPTIINTIWGVGYRFGPAS